MSAQYKKLYRPTEGRMLGGVCAGFAEYLQIDPTLVRIGFVVGSLLGWFPAFILAYLFMWILVPEENKVTSDITSS